MLPSYSSIPPFPKTFTALLSVSFAMLYLCSLAQSTCLCFDLPQTLHTSSLLLSPLALSFPPQAPREVLSLPALLIPSAAPAFVNLLKAGEDSDSSYVPNKKPAKSTSVPGLLSEDPADFCLLLLASGQASPAGGLTGNACSGCSGWMKNPPEENPGTGGAVCLRVCVRTRVHRYPEAALAPHAGSCIPFIAKFPFYCFPEGASDFCIPSQSSLESPPAFLHVSSPVQGEE